MAATGRSANGLRRKFSVRRCAAATTHFFSSALRRSLQEMSSLYCLETDQQELRSSLPFDFIDEATVAVENLQTTECSFLSTRALHGKGAWAQECPCRLKRPFGELKRPPPLAVLHRRPWPGQTLLTQVIRRRPIVALTRALPLTRRHARAVPRPARPQPPGLLAAPCLGRPLFPHPLERRAAPSGLAGVLLGQVRASFANL